MLCIQAAFTRGNLKTAISSLYLEYLQREDDDGINRSKFTNWKSAVERARMCMCVRCAICRPRTNAFLKWAQTSHGERSESLCVGCRYGGIIDFAAATGVAVAWRLVFYRGRLLLEINDSPLFLRGFSIIFRCWWSPFFGMVLYVFADSSSKYMYKGKIPGGRYAWVSRFFVLSSADKSFISV